jgi:hypothetical protein
MGSSGVTQIADPQRAGATAIIYSRNRIMQKNPTTDKDDVSQPLPEPVVLTEEEVMKIAAGLAKTVVGRGCYLCGIGALGPYQAT